MNKTLGVIFTIIYTLIAFFLGVLMGIHGPELTLPSSIGFLGIAIGILWWIYFFIKRKNFRRSSMIFSLASVGVGLLLVGAIIASRNPLIQLEESRDAKHAASVEVLNMKDEILFSKTGNPIGVRLNYQMRFPDSDYFWQSVSISPKDQLGASIWASMQMVNRNIEPPMTSTDPSKYAVRYEQGKTYKFTVDMIPDFVIQNVDKTKQCIKKPSKDYVDTFQKLIQNEDVRFDIIVSGTEFTGITANTYSFKEFYDSAIKEGALECAENQTNHF
jgi:hypothetical protein